MSEDGQTTPSTIEEVIAWGRREGKKRLSFVGDDPPPPGYVDLYVHQPNVVPAGDSPEAWEKYWKDFFIVPAYMQPISSVEGLIVAVRRACRPDRKLRLLRIMGHGNVGNVRIGLDQVGGSALVNIDTDEKTAMARELEKLNEWLDPEISLIVLDHCLAGQAKSLIVLLSQLWGGTPVRAFLDYQFWEHGDVQYGQGPYRQCAGRECHLGIELVRVE